MRQLARTSTRRGAPCVLYLGYSDRIEQHRLKLNGIRRFAMSQGWEVAAVPPGESRCAAVPELLRRIRPIGCVVECSLPGDIPPPRAFAGTSVVYLDPQDRLGWRGAATLTCDNAAVAAAAFRELSAALPPAYAVVGYRFRRQWARERLAAFRALCAEVGRECHVFQPRFDESEGNRAARMAKWAAALPRHCAIFAVNDFTAWEAEAALRASFRHVPREATIVGVDGYDHLPDGEVSRLSSVKLDFEHSGFMAARMLGEAMGGARFGPLLCIRRESTRGFGRHEPRILEAVAMIRAEACDRLTAADLARRFHCSRNLFERRFREAMGHSVLDEILHVRMEQVQSLLTRPDVRIGAIADFCGFGTARELQKLFHARTGMSMLQWRRAHCR